MTTPVDLLTNVGYCATADVYCSFTEYYGDGTVYGWRHLYIGEEVVRGAGKTKEELIALGAVQEEAVCPSVPADILVLSVSVPEVPVPEVPVPEVPVPEVPVPEVPVPEVPVPQIEKTPNTIVVKFKEVSITLTMKKATDVVVNVEENGSVTFSI